MIEPLSMISDIQSIIFFAPSKIASIPTKRHSRLFLLFMEVGVEVGYLINSTDGLWFDENMQILLYVHFLPDTT